jgi:hypothetical protein
MEADWEVEIGGGAPVIEAEWPGFVDLRGEPERVNEMEEVARFAPLGKLLKALNAPTSPLGTAKCDVWEAESGELCCYVDLLPVEGRVFSDWAEAENFCREVVVRLEAKPEVDSGSEIRVDLVVRAAVAGQMEGFGVTAYLSAAPAAMAIAETALVAAMDAFADAVLLVDSRAGDGSKLQ